MLPKGRSGLLSTMPWGARGPAVPWANRSVGVQSCLAPLRPATPPCAAPSRTARGMSGFWTRQINELVTNCSSTARQTFVMFPDWVYMGFVFRASEKTSGGIVFVVLGVEMEARPLAETLPPSRPARGISGFGFDRSGLHKI